MESPDTNPNLEIGHEFSFLHYSCSGKHDSGQPHPSPFHAWTGKTKPSNHQVRNVLEKFPLQLILATQSRLSERLDQQFSQKFSDRENGSSKNLEKYRNVIAV
jgi:hypothetical protein